MAEFAEDFSLSQNMYGNDDCMFMGEEFGNFDLIPSLSQYASGEVSNLGASYPEIQPTLPSSSLRSEEQELPGLPFDDSDLQMSPSFLGMGNVNDSQESVKLDLINTQDLIETYPLSNAKGSNGDSTVAGPSSATRFGIVDEIGISTNFIPAEEVVLLNDWTGDFNFKVTPLLDNDKTSKKKAVYDENQNKLFCTTSTAVKFKVEVDYEKINIEKYMVRAFLTYEDNDSINTPVLRCSACIEAETKLTEERTSLAILLDMKHRLPHMLRPCDVKSESEYFQHDVSKRCYILLPLKYPEPGMAFATKSFCFSCRNSCSRLNVEGKSRRAISIIFTLVDKKSGKVEGRSRTRVRVCSAPVRDYNKEQQAPAATTGGTSRKRKSTDGEPSAALPSPKSVNLGEAEAEIPLNQGNDGPRFLMHQPTIRSVLRASTRGRFEDDGVSSSQETVYSCDESEHKIQLRDLVQDLRWVLKQKHNENSVLRGYSSNVFNTVKLLQDLCNTARRYDREQREAPDGKSPDGGFHDVDVGQD